MRLSTTIRGGLFASLALIIVGGPALVQIFGVPAGPLNRPWRMYSGVGMRHCWVEFTDHGQPIDRFEVFVVENPRRSRWFVLEDEDEVRRVAERLCNRLPESDLRVHARCTVDGRIQTVIEPTEPLCR